MKIPKLKLWLALALTAALLATVFWWLVVTRSPAIIVTLPDGNQYRYAGANWGAFHAQPRLLSKLLDRLPNPIARRLDNTLKPKYGELAPLWSSEPTFAFWFQPLNTNAAPAAQAATVPGLPAPMLWVAVEDDQGVPAGLPGQLLPQTPWEVVASLRALPKRSKYLQMRFYPSLAFVGANRNREPVAAAPPIRVPNPFFGTHPQWTPEPLPATKTVDGLSVTLSNLAVGRLSAFSGNGGLVGTIEPAPPKQFPDTLFQMGFTSSPATNETWVPHAFELDDATGNVLRPTSADLRPSGGYHVIDGSLWPSETAWRLRVKMKRSSGYPAADLLTFKNLPVPVPNASNGISLNTNFAGTPFVFRNFRTSFISLNSGLNTLPQVAQLDWSNLPPNLAVDVVEVMTDTGFHVEHQQLLAPHLTDPLVSCQIGFQNIPPGTKTLNLTFAVQKLRTFDFYVKPPPLTTWVK